MENTLIHTYTCASSIYMISFCDLRSQLHGDSQAVTFVIRSLVFCIGLNWAFLGIPIFDYVLFNFFIFTLDSNSNLVVFLSFFYLSAIVIPLKQLLIHIDTDMSSINC